MEGYGLVDKTVNGNAISSESRLKVDPLFAGGIGLKRMRFLKREIFAVTLSNLLLPFLIFLFYPTNLFAGGEYTETNSCEIDYANYLNGRLKLNQLDVDELDNAYYFNENRNEILVFSSMCLFVKKISIKSDFDIKKYSFSEAGIKVRNGLLAIYPSWRGSKVYFRDVNSDEEFVNKDVTELVGKEMLTFINGNIVNYQTGKILVKSPFAKDKSTEFKAGNFEIVEETGLNSMSVIKTIKRTGTDFKTEKSYHGDYRFLKVLTIDSIENIYAIYQECIMGDDSIRPVKYNYMLIKFNGQLKETAFFNGNRFVVNESSMNVYVLKLVGNKIRIIKWMVSP